MSKNKHPSTNAMTGKSKIIQLALPDPIFKEIF